ncbi:hypothetical protein GJ744_006742 [Endocarpon pusillum]|uniref:Uncharacterized protein n=1 Tax=Endocarpon pusillum TaxID=364733 RepID=A0A8H7E6X3_9EURO|nr:hypothetical protein GJ744_006742 [Endocarpon pusillum]
MIVHVDDHVQVRQIPLFIFSSQRIGPESHAQRGVLSLDDECHGPASKKIIVHYTLFPINRSPISHLPSPIGWYLAKRNAT